MISNMIDFLTNQGINLLRGDLKEIEGRSDSLGFTLPQDFIDYFVAFNGMSTLYPNDYEREGFLLYPIEALSVRKINWEEEQKNVLIFADYLLECWWYGVVVLDDGSYSIGLIQDNTSFQFVTNNLFEFFQMIIEDDKKLYPN